MKDFDEENLRYKKFARADFGLWLIIIVHPIFSYLMFFYDYSIKTYYQSDSFLFWFFLFIYIFWSCAFLYAIFMVACNRARGSEIDLETGDFVWWQYTKKRKGRIAPADISKIHIYHGMDSSSISVCDKNGRSLPFLDGQVIPWKFDDWALMAQTRWPHIHVETK